MELQHIIGFFEALLTFVVAYCLARASTYKVECLSKNYWNDKKNSISAFPKMHHIHTNKSAKRARLVSNSYDDSDSLFHDFYLGNVLHKRATILVENFRNIYRMIATGIILSTIYLIMYFATSKTGSDILNFSIQDFLLYWGLFFSLVLVYPNVQRDEKMTELSKKHEQLLQEFGDLTKLSTSDDS